MNNPLQQTIEALAKEKGIEPEVIITAIEDAVLTASRKYYKTNENLRTRFNTDTGQVDLFAVKHIVQDVTNPATEIALSEAQELYGEEAEIDMEIEFPKSTEGLGRIAAQTVKQVISQKVREAERDNIYEEYSQRIGEVVTGDHEDRDRRDPAEREAVVERRVVVQEEPILQVGRGRAGLRGALAPGPGRRVRAASRE